MQVNMARTFLYLCGVACVLHLSNSLTNEHAQVFMNNGVQVESKTDSFVLLSNGVPNHEYGPFPNRDNPNNLTEQEHNYTIPKSPSKVDPPGCLPMGIIGIAINGVPLYNPYTADLYNAVEGEHKEVFDNCDGHPQMHGVYHYHKIPGCLFNGTRDQLLGVALDGYPVYGPIDESGRNLTTANLDFCHGRTSSSGEYRYHMTYDFPYILGCFTGEVDYDQLAQNRQPPPNGQPPRGDRPPPPGGMRPGGPGGQMPRDSCRYANETNPGLDDSPPGTGDGDTNGAALVQSTMQVLFLIVSVFLLHA